MTLEPTEDSTGRRVLIVEDEGMVAMMLEDMLGDLGYEVVATANRLDAAVRAIADTAIEIDLAVLDVNLNGEHTYPLAGMLTARRIPFVFSTGYGRAGLSDEWQDAPTLQKPFEMRQLERTMREALAATEPAKDRSASAAL